MVPRLKLTVGHHVEVVALPCRPMLLYEVCLTSGVGGATLVINIPAAEALFAGLTVLNFSHG